MKRLATPGPLLVATALVAFLTVAAPTHATITPISTTFTATSTNSNWLHTPSGISDRCPLSHFGDRTSADGRSISGNLISTASGGVTCTDNLFSSSMTFDCVGNLTFRSNASVAGASASGTISLDTGFRCEATVSLGTDWIIRGPQSPTNCTWTLSQGSQVLSVRCTTIAKDGGGTVHWTGSYRVNQRKTIS